MKARIVPIVMATLILAGGCTSNREAKQPKLSAETYYAAGQLAEAQNDLPRAVNEYRLALHSPGPHAPSLYRLGIIFTQAKRYALAIEAWQEYITATYGSALAYSDLAYTYELSGDSAAARQAYQSALQKEPANPTCRVNYGILLARSGDIPGAEEQLRGILTEGQVHYQIGIACQQNKKWDEARKQFEKAAAADPQLLDAKARLAEINSPTASN